MATPGLRLRLTYFDQNEAFAEILPRDGTVERSVGAKGGAAWAVFFLDRPVDYEGRTYSHFLLRSRWQGQTIGDGTRAIGCSAVSTFWRKRSR